MQATCPVRPCANHVHVKPHVLLYLALRGSILASITFLCRPCLAIAFPKHHFSHALLFPCTASPMHFFSFHKLLSHALLCYLGAAQAAVQGDTGSGGAEGAQGTQLPKLTMEQLDGTQQIKVHGGVHGGCMGCAWDMHGVCVGYIWGVHGICMGCAWAHVLNAPFRNARFTNTPSHHPPITAAQLCHTTPRPSYLLHSSPPHRPITVTQALPHCVPALALAFASRFFPLPPIDATQPFLHLRP